jgi:hemerythrin
MTHDLDTDASPAGFMPWHAGYRVGIRTLDAQHAHLVGSLNALHAGLVAGCGEAEVTAMLADLRRDVQAHFGAEEALLRAHGYPEDEQHQFAHAQCLLSLWEFQRRCEADSMLLSLGPLTFLKSWLGHHILGTDKHYGPFLVGKGVR